jgi:Domain of unknown function (DUF1835)
MKRIHITSGDAPLDKVRAVVGPDPEILVHHDVLSCGPLTRFDALEAWSVRRGAFWGASVTALGGEHPAHDVLENAPRLVGADEIVLWLGTGLSDQLLLAWTVRLCALVGADATKISVVQIANTPDDPRELLGVGMLTVEALHARTTPVPLSDAARAEATAAWAAVTAADPEPLRTLLAHPGAALPVLHRALGRLVYRFPNVSTGLGYWDRALVAAAGSADRAFDLIVAVLRAAAAHPDPVGDFYLFRRLERLANPAQPAPLMTLEGMWPESRTAMVHLTDAGRDVLAGRANAVHLNGLDDWVGGIHLDAAAGHIWWEDGGRIV